MRKAVRLLGGMLERRFAEMMPEGRDIEIIAPVRLAIALQMTELIEATRTEYDDRSMDPLYERFRAAVEQAVAQAVQADPIVERPRAVRLRRAKLPGWKRAWRVPSRSC